MSKEIWKFGVGITDTEQKIIMPKVSKFLTAQMQNGKPHVWAIVDPETEHEEKTIRVYATGQALPNEAGTYIGTVQIWDTVWHIFEINKH
jgi:hypothetical protein